MKNPYGHDVARVQGVRMSYRIDAATGDSIACVEIIAPGVAEGFKIFYGIDSTLSVDEVVTGEKGLLLAANVPNPVTNSTEIAFETQTRSAVRLEIFDVNGKQVATLVDRTLGAGRHTASWDGRSADGSKLPSGTYTYRLTAGSAMVSRTMILAR